LIDNRIDDKKLIKWIYFVPIISIIVTIILTAAIFIYEGQNVYERDVQRYKKSLMKKAY